MNLNKQYILQLDKGDEVRKKIINFALQHNIIFAQISAIGMVKNFTLGFWNFKNQTHDFKKFTFPYELTSFLGTISFQNNNYDLHAHATLSNQKLQTIGGHFGDGQVAVLMQCVITVINQNHT